MEITINFWAVLVSAVAGIFIGSIWYGPLFGKKFMALMGFEKLSADEQEKMKKGMAITYALQFLSSVLMLGILAWLMSALGANTHLSGMRTAFWVWLGFVMPVQLGQQLWGGKIGLFWLGAGNMLLTLLAAGAILGAWQ